MFGRQAVIFEAHQRNWKKTCVSMHVYRSPADGGGGYSGYDGLQGDVGIFGLVLIIMLVYFRSGGQRRSRSGGARVP